jgi:2,3-bisphosphoglycerate-dependent phosphoglycerate mutase
MQLYLIRHAESENNARPVYLRVEDPSITTIGRMQAQHLAQWTKTLKIDVLITSPFLRTLQTTQAVIETTQMPVSVWHNVFERGGCYRGFGDEATEGGPGLGGSKIREMLPGAIIDESILDTGWWVGRQRETHAESVLRSATVIQRLVATYGNSGKHVVAIIHADFKRQLLLHMLEGIADASSFGPLRNTGITKVDFDGNRWRLDWLNSVSHLPASLITGVE